MDELTPHLEEGPGRSRLDQTQDGDAGSRSDLQVALTRATHDINNPLAIISGNAQLLMELSRALDLDPDVAKPIQDIEEASQRLAVMVERLNALNDPARAQGFGGDGM